MPTERYKRRVRGGETECHHTTPEEWSRPQPGERARPLRHALDETAFAAGAKRNGTDMLHSGWWGCM
jgi:hypothetical protein